MRVDRTLNKPSLPSRTVHYISYSFKQLLCASGRLGHLKATFNIWAIDWATVNSFEKHTLKQVQYLAYCQQITAN